MNDITYAVKFGFKVHDDKEQQGVFRCKEVFSTIEEAKADVYETFRSTIQTTFPNAKNTGLTMFERHGNGTNMFHKDDELFGAMGGGFDGGEFCIYIIRA